jgi:hypothetical protein
VLIALAALVVTAAAHEIDEVELDTASGVFGRHLPFDVPFVITGKAPPGTTRVELSWEVDKAAGSGTTPRGPLVSGVEADGRFRILMEPVRPDHDFRFRLVFERRLPAGGAMAFRSAVEGILRREIGGLQAAGLDAARARLVAEALVMAYQQALNEGQVIAAPRGEVELVSPGGPLASGQGDEAQAVELRRLCESAFQAEAERALALERYRDTARSLQRQLAEISASASLARLLEALEARPESDPRNPRSVVFLPPGSRRLIGASEAELASRAEGRGVSQPTFALRDAASAEEADAFRERYRRTAEDLQGLREWLQGLVLTGGELRRLADPLLLSGELSPEDVSRLAGLASFGTGAIRRAEQWAETLQVYAHEVQSSLAARERAFSRAAGEIGAQASGALLRQSLVTEKATSKAGIYVSLDVGALYPPELERASLYLGANVYFRPVNKKAPLRANSPGQRLALTFGLSVTNMKLEGETRFENLLGEKSNLLVGLGYRLTRSLRLGGGMVLFLKNDPNPLVDARSLAITPYVSLSFDIDLLGAFRGN